MTTKLLPALLASLFAAAFTATAIPSTASLTAVEEGVEPTSPAAPAGSSSPRPDPTTAGDCKAIAADPTQDAPPGDTTTPTPTGGASDRLMAIAEVVKKKRPAFRCCFDIWAGKIPEARLYTKVAYTLKLDPAGKVVSTSAKAEEGGPAGATEVGACLEAVGAGIVYPPSPSSKETTYTHHFDFKPRKRH